jgi:hypothetical protein
MNLRRNLSRDRWLQRQGAHCQYHLCQRKQLQQQRCWCASADKQHHCSTTSTTTFARGGLMSRSATALSPVRMINYRFTALKAFEAFEGVLNCLGTALTYI